MNLSLTKFISIIYRQGQRYYDRELVHHGIGCGQQFFLLRIYENDGISMYDLAVLGHFDKGTVTKAVQKLEEEGYLRIETDPADRRVRRLHVTDKAEAVIQTTYSVRSQWTDILTKGFTEEELTMADRLLSRMAENAYQSMNGGDQLEHKCSRTNETKSTGI